MSSDLTPGSGASAENEGYDIFELQTPPAAIAPADTGVTDVVQAGPRSGRRRGLVIGSAFATAAACAIGLVAFNSSGASAASPHLAASPSPSASPKAGDHPTPGPRTPHLDGTVTSVSGSKILIKDFDGFTRTIIVSSTTTYSDSLTATPAVGTKLAAEGTVDADGTSLDATKVSAPKAHEGGPGGFGGHGPGRPDGSGPGKSGSAPSGSPKPSPSASPSASPSS